MFKPEQKSALKEYVTITRVLLDMFTQGREDWVEQNKNKNKKEVKYKTKLTIDW